MLINYIFDARCNDSSLSGYMKQLLLSFLPVLFFLQVTAQKDSLIVRKEFEITRALKTPKIDGIVDDVTWANLPAITTFTQNYPLEKGTVTQKNEVKLVYDNTAIYISAILFDTAPDSIRHQLGNRDDQINADIFRIVFDTYNTQQDAFDFSVTASGVQLDSKFSDASYNAVWESAVKITDIGWTVEIKIPYSALRFPNVNEQTWGMQITRSIARNKEFDQWALTPRGVPNGLLYWGLLKGLKDIKAPIRLSLTPYITAYTSHYPTNVEGEDNYTSNITGGLDLKYGINESFTVDVSLLPDFTQVQSDNVVKNLSAFEVQYDEQRPFFQEGTDLFQKGDLFYSRRIGRRPTEYNAVYSTVDHGETIVKNPDQAKLLNATKISGRTAGGLGVGILNSVLGNTYAVARDSAGHERKILTEPFSNYNIIVFDQQLKYGSSAYLINTNVNRQGPYNNSNVTGAGFNLNNRKNSYGLYFQSGLSNVFTKTDTVPNQYTDLFGYTYNINFSKTSGNFQFSLVRDVSNPTFDNNDMGITRETNFTNHALFLSLYRFKPYRNILNADASYSFVHSANYTTGRTNSMTMSLNGNVTFKSFNSFYLGADGQLQENIDYYEPRTPGRIFTRPKSFSAWGGLNTDIRKKVYAGFNVYYGSTGLISPTIGYNPFFGITLSPSFRVNDKLSVDLSGEYSEDNGDRGYVNTDEWGNIIFGLRFLTNLTTSAGARYLFRNNLSLLVRARHYWARGDYRSFYTLSEDGHLLDNIGYDQNHDFNFNAFNVDMVFQWQFAPGSSLNLVWKNSIYNEGPAVINSYSGNMRTTFEAKQLNTVSLKILYYFDYLYLVKKKRAK